MGAGVEATGVGVGVAGLGLEVGTGVAVGEGARGVAVGTGVAVGAGARGVVVGVGRGELIGAPLACGLGLAASSAGSCTQLENAKAEKRVSAIRILFSPVVVCISLILSKAERTR